MENKNRRNPIIGKRRPARANPDRVQANKEDTKVFNIDSLNESDFRYQNARRRNQGIQRQSAPRQSTAAGVQRRPVTRPMQGQVRRNPQRPRSYQETGPLRPQNARPQQNRRYEGQPVRERPRKRRGFGRFLLGLLTLLLILAVGFTATVYAYARFGSLNPDLSGNVSLYNISSNAAAVAGAHRIASIAIFGIDGRDDVEGDRSDAIMIGTADYEHNKLKVTSLMRDTYSEMAGEDYFDKLNAAYSIGGAEEAVRTINLNFDTAITDYVVFDFTALVAMVNAVGGVDINVTDEEELYWINQYLMDVNNKVGTSDPDVPGIGVQHLTGSQALSYARIRYTGNGDYDRTQRQRNILEQVVAKASAMSAPQQLALIQSVMPYIQTSLRPSEIIKYALNLVMMDDKTIEQSRLPADGLCSDGYLDGVSYIFPDTLVDNIKAWYSFVYDIDYTPSETAEEISEEIEYVWW